LVAAASPFARKRYYEKFDTVELQNTFYQLPSLDYAKRLRSEAPPGFVFNMKAWQVITHPPRSPTWRRLRKPPPGNLENYGYLRPTRENIEAWRLVHSFAVELGARVVVLQTPPSFRYSEENVANITKFFSVIERGGVIVGWEPRADWNSRKEVLEEIICRMGLLHVVDPFRHQPVICAGQRTLYFRLHGIGSREVNYRYRYTDEDLQRLASYIHETIISKKDIKEIYVMFNNIYMGEDAERFKTIASQNGLPLCGERSR